MRCTKNINCRIMAKLWKSDRYPIPWITNEEEEDFMATIGDYCLRVEQMDADHYWWRVYLCGEPIPTPHNEYAQTREQAIALAEGVYFGHISLVRKTIILPSKLNQDNDQ